jgi:glucokinase
MNTVQIVADIGGTNARFAYVDAQSDALRGIETLPCSDYADIAEAINTYRLGLADKDVTAICLAVAGPVEKDFIDLPNNHWAFSRAALAQELGVALSVINDFSAQVMCVPALAETEISWLGEVRPDPSGQWVIAALGPGTGLGVSARLPSGAVVPSEAGHISFAPQTDREIAILQCLWQRYNRVSVERLLSGKGLENLYWANALLAGREQTLSAPQITEGARRGNELCARAVTDFIGILGSVAGDVALMMGALGGVYLSGGILPQMVDLLDVALLRERFENKGRFSEMCRGIPLGMICADYPGLRGCVQVMRAEQSRG